MTLAADFSRVRIQADALTHELGRYLGTPLTDYHWEQLIKHAPDHVVRSCTAKRPVPTANTSNDKPIETEYSEAVACEEENNARTTGLLVDTGDETERYTLKLDGRSNLSDEVMDLADKLGTQCHTVDYKAWDHLLIYAPQHNQLKKELAKTKRKLRKIRKIVK